MGLRSLKWVLWHITNVYGSTAIGHPTAFKKNYDFINYVLTLSDPGGGEVLFAEDHEI